jgi:hypothetical protein
MIHTLRFPKYGVAALVSAPCVAESRRHTILPMRRARIHFNPLPGNPGAQAAAQHGQELFSSIHRTRRFARAGASDPAVSHTDMETVVRQESCESVWKYFNIYDGARSLFDTPILESQKYLSAIEKVQEDKDEN